MYFRLKANYFGDTPSETTLSTTAKYDGVIENKFTSIDEAQKAINRAVYIFRDNDHNSKVYVSNCTFVVEQVLERDTVITKDDMPKADTTDSSVGYFKPNKETLARRKKMVQAE